MHLPFCPYLCPYCDFAKWAYRRSDAERYLRALHREIDALPAVSAGAYGTLFFGGGTPSTYETEAIAGLVERLRARGLADDAEITLEANPEPGLAERLAGLRAAGITRLSIGVQTLVDEELATLGRRHVYADVVRCVAAARAAGFALSLDLIFAVPGQTLASWRTTLARAVALAPDHCSTYGLTVEEGTPYATWFAREPERFASSDLEAELYAAAIETLGAAGYEHYEISNFAKPGFRCEHNENYWANGEYLGLGVGAASYRDGERSVATRELATYCAALEAGTTVPRERERLGGERAAGEAAMLRLRTLEGIDVAAFSARYGLDVEAVYARPIAEFEEAGLLARGAGRIALTERGRFVANDVCAAFLG